MLLTITLTEPPATDLGFLLHTHPDRLQSCAVSAGAGGPAVACSPRRRCSLCRDQLDLLVDDLWRIGSLDHQH